MTVSPRTSARTVPLFSVITVTLNAGAALAETVQSVLSQECEDFECLVKDGGSTDGSTDGFPTDGRLMLVVRPDHGIYDAMNQALEVASGRFVVFLNAGDVLAGRDVLAKVASVVAHMPQEAIAYCDYRNKSLGVVVLQPRSVTKWVLFRRPLCHQTCFVPRVALLRCGGFDTSLALSADHDALVRLMLNGGVVARHVSMVGVIYDGAGVSAAKHNRKQLIAEFSGIRRRYFTRWERLKYASVTALTAPALRRSLLNSKRARVVYAAVINTARRGMSRIS
jgi:glycosyltransferase involved in cell wall biosynthesis